MADSEPHDLSDTWHGRFVFPRLNEPVSFTAVITQIGAVFDGTVDEPAPPQMLVPRLTSTITGSIAGLEVAFLKTYDIQGQGYGAVNYAGVVADGGLEIHGTWSIPGSWSGWFIMIRSRGLPSAIARKLAERIDVPVGSRA